MCCELPRDVVKEIVRRLDVDTRRALGVYTRLDVPPELDRAISSALLARGEWAVELGRVHGPRGSTRPMYLLNGAFNAFRGNAIERWVEHWTWYGDTWCQTMHDVAKGESVSAASRDGDLVVMFTLRNSEEEEEEWLDWMSGM